MRRPHISRHRNANYDPNYSRWDERVQCSVCGFRGIDPQRVQEPEKAVFTIVQTGSTYQPDAGTPVDDLGSTVDVQTERQIAAGSGCPFCGSPRWRDGSAPDLRW